MINTCPPNRGPASRHRRHPLRPDVVLASIPEVEFESRRVRGEDDDDEGFSEDASSAPTSVSRSPGLFLVKPSTNSASPLNSAVGRSSLPSIPPHNPSTSECGHSPGAVGSIASRTNPSASNSTISIKLMSQPILSAPSSTFFVISPQSSSASSSSSSDLIITKSRTSRSPVFTTMTVPLVSTRANVEPPQRAIKSHMAPSRMTPIVSAPLMLLPLRKMTPQLVLAKAPVSICLGPTASAKPIVHNQPIQGYCPPPTPNVERNGVSRISANDTRTTSIQNAPSPKIIPTPIKPPISNLHDQKPTQNVIHLQWRSITGPNIGVVSVIPNSAATKSNVQEIVSNPGRQAALDPTSAETTPTSSHSSCVVAAAAMVTVPEPKFSGGAAVAEVVKKTKCLKKVIEEKNEKTVAMIDTKICAAMDLVTQLLTSAVRDEISDLESQISALKKRNKRLSKENRFLKKHVVTRT